MIDALRAYLTPFSPTQKVNALREYLQWVILQILDEAGQRSRLIFTGGTCLRVVYGIGRFSEDLDFSAIIPIQGGLGQLKDEIAGQIARRGLAVDVSVGGKQERSVSSLCIRFPNLLFPLGLSAQKTQVVSIKLEVDQNPPQGGAASEFYRSDPIPFLVNHFDPPSLFATKAHALFFRGFEKGRDYYDLAFFLGRKVSINWGLFQNAVRQTHPDQNFAAPQDFWTALLEKIRTLDERKIMSDVRPFLLKPEEERFLKKEILSLAVRQTIEGSTQDSSI